MGSEDYGVSIFSIEGKIVGIHYPLGPESDAFIVKVGKIKYSIPFRRIKNASKFFRGKPAARMKDKEILFENGKMTSLKPKRRNRKK